jgi:hypothetical protein
MNGPGGDDLNVCMYVHKIIVEVSAKIFPSGLLQHYHCNPKTLREQKQ